jgi:hypothetical protein
LNIPNDLINQIVQWLVSVFISSILSTIVGSLVETFSGDILKKLLLNIRVINPSDKIYDYLKSKNLNVFTAESILVKMRNGEKSG